MGLFKFYWTDATNSLKTSVSNGKSLIASAITDKGISTASDATFQTMASNIRAIKASPNIRTATLSSPTYVTEGNTPNYNAYFTLDSGNWVYGQNLFVLNAQVSTQFSGGASFKVPSYMETRANVIDGKLRLTGINLNISGYILKYIVLNVDVAYLE